MSGIKDDILLAFSAFSVSWGSLLCVFVFFQMRADSALNSEDGSLLAKLTQVQRKEMLFGHDEKNNCQGFLEAPRRHLS
jgi:hypothetical protein